MSKKSNTKIDRSRKLTAAIVKRIKAAWAKANGPTIRELAAKYHVGTATITHLLYGITWKTVK